MLLSWPAGAESKPWRLPPSVARVGRPARRFAGGAAVSTGRFRAPLRDALPAALRRAALFRGATGGGGFAATRMLLCAAAYLTAKEPGLFCRADGGAGGPGRCLRTSHDLTRGALDIAHYRFAALRAFSQHGSDDATDGGAYWSADGADDSSCGGSGGGFADRRDRDGLIGAGHDLLGS